jgi:hypothetical protein
VPTSLTYGDVRMLNHLFECTPCLQRLNINNTYWKNYSASYEPIFSSLISFKTYFYGDTNSMIDLLQRLPNLSYLSLEISDIRMDGNDWANLLINHLPKLKKFHLKMNLNFLSADNNMQTSMDQLVDSFRTSFWLEQHQWYVRGNCYFSNQYHHGVLYTLPYIFDQCSYLNSDYSISTKPDDEELSSWKHIQSINMENNQIESFHDLNIYMWVNKIHVLYFQLNVRMVNV